MRFLFLIKSLGVAGGGAERVIGQVVGELARRGHEVELVTFDLPGTTDFYPISPIVPRVRLGIGDVTARSAGLDFVQKVRATRRLLRASSPDLAVGFMHSAFVPLAVASVGVGIPIIGSEHIVFDYYRERPRDRLALVASAGLLAGLTSVSEPMREGFPNRIRKKMVAVPNPVQVEQSTRASLAERPENILLNVGRLEPQKDQATLIAAFARVAAGFPDWKLRIVGEGVLRGRLEEQARSLHIAGRIELPGTSSNVDEEYSSARIFCVSSLYESFGLVTAEALANGVPAVGFADCPGTNELIQTEINGLLVDGPDRVQALSEGLARLMGDEKLRKKLGAAGPVSVRHYSLEAVTDRWEALLLSVANRAAPSRDRRERR